MRDNTRPTEAQLRHLYEVAAEFKRIQPWRWLYDKDLICVEDPVDKTMGYCSVMGNAGQHYALGVYLGDEGLYLFYEILKNSDVIPGHQALHYNNCLMCSFEDRDLLSPEDRKQIKELGLSFRGRNAWPLFRRYEPGYHPWVINEAECVFLTHALRQTLVAARGVLNGELKMDMEQGKTIVRFSEQKADELEWHSKEVELAVPSVSYNPIVFTDDELIRKIKKAGRRMEKVSLQVDVCYMFSPVQEHKSERPYYPRMIVIAEQRSGHVLTAQMFSSISEDANVTFEKIIETCLSHGAPGEIQVRSLAMVAILKGFCAKAGIKLKHVQRLASIDEMLQHMARRF